VGVPGSATRYAETLSKIDDPYLRERALDIQDVTKRVIRNLQGKAPKAFLSLSQPHILVAHNLTPSDTASMSRDNVLGIATDVGSRTSHAAILARSLNIPAVLGLHDITAKARNRSARSCRWERWLVDRQSDAGNAGVLQAN
jgi:phosphotransferase system enzyme I (PtsI)